MGAVRQPPRGDITRALPDYTPRATLLPFVEGTTKEFRCPEGDDTTRGSPAYGQPFQVSYALNPRLGGRRLEGPVVPGVLATEHMGLPNCASAAAHWDPWPTDPETARARHVPLRHMGVANALGRDAHVGTAGP